MKAFLKPCLMIFICIFMANASVLAADKKDFSTAPKMNDGKKWRVGYYEGGEFRNYKTFLISTVNGLMKLGWIETAEFPPQEGAETKALWTWLSTQMKSKYVEFVEDAHYGANWDRPLRKKMTSEIISRLNQKKDIDLMIGAGTWAGQDLANDKHQTPTMVISVSDALASGIIKSIEDSGFDHIHARVDPLRYERQIQIFHDIIGFRKLGVAYQNDKAGRSYAAVDKIEKIAKERGFDIISCHIKAGLTLKQEEENMKKCFRELGKKADAIYVTLHTGVNKKSIPELVAITNSNRIPTFSQIGSKEVRYGLLASLSQAGFIHVGQFQAEIMAKIFNGAKPRQLDQVFQDPPKIAINLKTAEIIGYDPPMEVLGIVDETYEEIEKPEE